MEEKNKKKKEEEKCPLCEVSKETLERLKEAGKEKETKEKSSEK